MNSEKFERTVVVALEQAQYLFDRMLPLAECSASSKCSDEERKQLQKALEVLQGLQNYNADQYERG